MFRLARSSTRSPSALFNEAAQVHSIATGLPKVYSIATGIPKVYPIATGIPKVYPIAGTPKVYSIATGIPMGASPQVLVSAVAPHRSGASKDVAEMIFAQGASIASTKKVMLEDQFAMLLSVWAPPDIISPEALAKMLTSEEVTDKLGFSMTAKLLDPGRPPSDDVVDKKRLLKITMKQQPGIVLAITRLLKDFNCKMSKIDADTITRGSEIWFEIEAVLDVPEDVDSASVEAALRFWAEKKDAHATLAFEGF